MDGMIIPISMFTVIMMPKGRGETVGEETCWDRPF
jgi:hypothetical protein